MATAAACARATPPRTTRASRPTRRGRGTHRAPRASAGARSPDAFPARGFSPEHRGSMQQRPTRTPQTIKAARPANTAAAASSSSASADAAFKKTGASSGGGASTRGGFEARSSAVTEAPRRTASDNNTVVAAMENDLELAEPPPHDTPLYPKLRDAEHLHAPNANTMGVRKKRGMSGAAAHDVVSLRAGAATMEATTDGRITLRRRNPATGASEANELVARSHVHLPAEAHAHGGVVSARVLDDDGFVVATEIRWGSVAKLRVESAAATAREARRNLAPWNETLTDGFVIDFAVNPDAVVDASNAMAEVKVDVADAGDWFGGGHLMKQHWPLNLGCWEVGPHYPFDNGPNGINTLVSTHWVTSGGLAVLCDPDTPYLHVGLNAPQSTLWDKLVSNRSFGVGIQNATRVTLPFSVIDREGDGMLRLQARGGFCKGQGCFQMDHPMIGWESAFASQDEGVDCAFNPEGTWLSMKVGMCALSDVRAAAEAALGTLPRPSGPPPAEVIRAPIWTTWARYKQHVDQRKTLEFAREILENKLPGSVMEIDDKWQVGYGELDFDPVKFPDPKRMVDELHAMGFKVTLWVMPFIEEDTEAYREGSAAGYFVDSAHPHHPFDVVNGLKPGFFKWWNAPPVVALDVTNPDAVDWFVSRLRSLQDRHGVDGFKFDAGEPCFLPRKFETHLPLTHPSEYTRAWVHNVAAKFDLAEVRTGHHTTGTALLTRMGDRFSEWGVGNGLRSIIPTLLTSGVMGYPFCLPDMIGGNAYFGRHPDRELLVRWAQANALMPAMQFSIAPWDVSADVAELCAECLQLREHVVEALIDLTHDAVATLNPMCRPMWWLDPTDAQTYRIDDQFAIGDDLIVAPVVTKGATTRNVYLTAGEWVEAGDIHGEVFAGGRWIVEMAAPLSKLPCFVRRGSDAHALSGRRRRSK